MFKELFDRIREWVEENFRKITAQGFILFFFRTLLQLLVTILFYKTSILLLISATISFVLPFIVHTIGVGGMRILIEDSAPIQIGTAALVISLSSMLFSASRSALRNYERTYFYKFAKKFFLSGLNIVILFTLTFIFTKFELKEPFLKAANSIFDDYSSMTFKEYSILFFAAVIIIYSLYILTRIILNFVPIYIHLHQKSAKTTYRTLRDKVKSRR